MTHCDGFVLQVCPLITTFITLWLLVVGSGGVKGVPFVIFEEIKDVRVEPGSLLTLGRVATLAWRDFFNFIFYIYLFILFTEGKHHYN